MTKEVFITIEGWQLGSEEEPVITKVAGTYHFANGRHYVRYEERLPEEEEVTENTMKIAPGQVTLSKKGKTPSVMEFVLDGITQTAYRTPYGSLLLGIRTDSMLLEEKDDLIEIRMEYSLSTDASQLSDNRIVIRIASKI